MHRPALPEDFARYRLLRRFSSGGMGEVFVARLISSEAFLRPVVLERVRAHLLDDPEHIGYDPRIGAEMAQHLLAVLARPMCM